MHFWVNSLIEGEFEHSALASGQIATSGLENLVRLHRLAGRDVQPATINGEPGYEVRHGDGRVHAVHWLAPADSGSPRPL
jgi:hypothetical protein